MEYTIKPEFVGKTVKIYDRFKGTQTIVVNNLDLSKVKYYQTIGLKHIFEEVVTATAPESTVIEYTAVEDVPVKKKRTKKFVERLEEEIKKRDQELINSAEGNG
jgi:hypothetical protein